MRIADIHVEGFGALRERSIPMDQPFVLIHGSNEAGKSTLTSFIRAILFGFAARSQSDQRLAERYEPMSGGTFGGSLSLINEQGERILVERYERGNSGRGRASAGTVKVTFPDGSTGGEEELTSLLGGISGEVFRTLFAFGLTELQELRTLQKDEIGSYMYSAGLGISPSAMLEGERKLAARMDQLYKGRGRNQQINLQLKAFEELELSIRRSKDSISQYSAIREEERSAAIRIEQLEDNRIRLLSQHAWIETCLKAHESWLRWNVVEAELAELPEWPQFPEQAVSRYEAIVEEQEQLATSYSECLLRIDQLDTLIEQLSLDEQIIQHKSDIESLIERTAHYQTDIRSADELKVEYAQTDKELQRTLRLIDSEWTEANLEAFPIAAATREQLNEYKMRLDELARVREQLAMEERSLKEQIKQMEEEMVKLREQKRDRERGHSLGNWLYSLKTLTDQVSDPIQHLRAIASQYAKYNLLEQECEHLRQRIEDRELQLLLTEQLANKQEQVNSSNASLAPIAIGIVGILGGILLYMQGSTPYAIVLLGIGLGGAIAIAVINRMSSKTNRRDRSRRGRSGYALQDRLKEDGQLADQTSVLRHKLARTEQDLLAIQDMLQDQVHVCWQISTGSLQSISLTEYTWMAARRWLDEQFEGWQRAAEEHDGQREKWQQLEITITELERRMDVVGKQLDKQQSRIRMHAAELEEASAQWSKWLSTHGFSKHLSPQALEGSLPLVEQGHSLMHQLRRLAARLAAAEVAAASFEAAAGALLGAAAAGDPILGVKRQGEALAHELRKREDAARAAADRRAAELEALSLRQRLDQHQLRIAALMQECRAESEHELRANARLAARRAELDGERRHLLPALTALVQGHQRLQELDAMLSAHGEIELAAQADELTQQLAQVTREVNALRERRGLLAGEAAKLELGAEHSDKLQRREELLAELGQSGREYAVHAFALHLLRKARAVYEEERQPGVLRRASDYFARMTQHRFSGIRAPLTSEQKLEAVRPDGRGVDTAYLSRGTAEQLYLAMRFALAEEYAARVNLPLIMDDILVNFDGERMEACLEVLNELSSRHQIILFTCHQHVRDTALRRLPKLHLVEL